MNIKKAKQCEISDNTQPSTSSASEHIATSRPSELEYGDEDSDLKEFGKVYGTNDTVPTLQLRNDLIEEVNETLEDESRSNFKVRKFVIPRSSQEM